MRKILFLIPYPSNHAPSQRFRFEQYLEILKKNGFVPVLEPFLTEKGWMRLYLPDQSFAKFIDVLAGFFKRGFFLFKMNRYDFVFIHREACPIGPPILEWIIAKLFRKKIIYDFDDAIWLTDQKNEHFLFKALKWRSKVKLICKWAFKISCGNQYLLDYALKNNSSSFLIPTTIDTDHHSPNKIKEPINTTRISIGWTGSHSTLKYLDEIVPALQVLEAKYPTIEIHIIADKTPSIKLKNVIYHPWSRTSEIEDLLLFDIGLMPLPDDEWSKGKCGFKALQYLSLGIPAIVSPVGVNSLIIAHGENGFLANHTNEWVQYIEVLINNPELRSEMGDRGKLTIQNHYSVSSITPGFLALFG